MSDAIEIIQATFEEIHPGRGNHYAEHPIIKKYLEETTLDPLACSMKKDCEKTFSRQHFLLHSVVVADLHSSCDPCLNQQFGVVTEPM